MNSGMSHSARLGRSADRDARNHISTARRSQLTAWGRTVRKLRITPVEMAAAKAVPLGQTDGQKMLLALGARLHDLGEGETGNFAPGLAML